MQRRVQRQEDVEADLDHQRPRLRDAAERAPHALAVHHRAAGVVQVHEEEVLEDAAAARDRHRDPDEQGDAHERDPVGRVDAQEPMPRVRARDRAGRRPANAAATIGRYSRKPEIRKKISTPTSMSREVVADGATWWVNGMRTPAQLERGRECRVVEHHEDRRERTEPVEAREPLARAASGGAVMGAAHDFGAIGWNQRRNGTSAGG